MRTRQKSFYCIFEQIGLVTIMKQFVGGVEEFGKCDFSCGDYVNDWYFRSYLFIQ